MIREKSKSVGFKKIYPVGVLKRSLRNSGKSRLKEYMLRELTQKFSSAGVFEDFTFLIGVSPAAAGEMGDLSCCYRPYLGKDITIYLHFLEELPSIPC